MGYDINNLKFRTLRPDEIDVRVGNVVNGKKFKGVTLLLYQDARCAMDILDETVGCGNWQRDHKEVKGNMYAGISIWDEGKKQWITKWDCGTESNTEKEKGESSDSFKRSAVNWQIGRELYSSPTIMVEAELKPKDGGRGYELADKYQFNGAKVTHIAYNDKREITELVIEDKSGNTIFSYPKGGKKRTATLPKKEVKNHDYKPSDMITAEEAEHMKGMLENLGYDASAFLSYVSKKMKSKIESVDSMTKEEYVCGMKAIEAMEAKMKGESN